MDRDVEGGLGENEGVAIHSSGKHPAQFLVPKRGEVARSDGVVESKPSLLE